MKPDLSPPEARETPSAGRATACLGLAVLLATALGCEGWAPQAGQTPQDLQTQGATQGVAETLDEAAGLWRPEEALASGWLDAPLVEGEPAVVPLAEPPAPSPKRSSLAAQGLDTGPIGVKTQEAHPGLPLPRTLDPTRGRGFAPRSLPCSSPRSWRAPVRGARAPPPHLPRV